MSIKPYKKNAFRTTDANGNYIFAECDEKSASEMNRFDWREDYQERKRSSPVKGKDADGNTLDFDPMGDSRECSLDNLIENGGEPYLRGYIEDFEDDIINKIYVHNILAYINPTLSDEDRNIIIAEMKGISPQEYEKKYKTPRSTYRYRREKLFDRLRSMIEAREQEKGNSSLAKM